MTSAAGRERTELVHVRTRFLGTHTGRGKREDLSSDKVATHFSISCRSLQRTDPAVQRTEREIPAAGRVRGLRAAHLTRCIR